MFNILNVNCRSVVNKVTELEGILLTHSPDIVILTETWLNDSIKDNEFVPRGYNVHRKDQGVWLYCSRSVLKF